MVKFCIGDHVLDGSNYVGVVRFVGLIPKSNFPEDTWIGVEWFDHSRGKYDGSIYGNQYFICPMGAGSFIRPSKLKKGISFVEAIVSKYNDDQQPSQIAVNSSYILKRQDANGAFLHLNNVDMSNWPIVQAGTGISSLCPNITLLNLANTSLTSWVEVFTIISNLHALENINLSGTKLGAWPSDSKLAFESPNLRSLILNNTELQWATIRAALATLPSVKELYLANNGYADVELLPCCNLTLLDLCSNNISDFDKLQLVCTSSPVETLLLCGNPLTNINLASWRHADDNCAPLSRSLRHLSVDRSLISNWESIDELNFFPSLTEISCYDLPLFDSISDAERRMLLIARLKNVTKLNHSPVSAEERERAERFFVRYYSQQDDKPSAYHRLRGLYGDLQPLADISLEPEAASIVVLFEGKPMKDFMVDVRLPVSDFIHQVAHCIGCRPSEIDLYHKSPYDYARMPHTQRKLFSWRLQEGDEIHIFLKTAKSPPKPVRGITNRSKGSPLKVTG